MERLFWLLIIFVPDVFYFLFINTDNARFCMEVPQANFLENMFLSSWFWCSWEPWFFFFFFWINFLASYFNQVLTPKQITRDRPVSHPCSNLSTILGRDTCTGTYIYVPVNPKGCAKNIFHKCILSHLCLMLWVTIIFAKWWNS